MASKHPNASSPTDKLVGQSVKIAKKIAAQIIRFQKMTPKELMAHFNGNRFSSFCSLETPNGEFVYGLEGAKQFLKMSEILISYKPELKGKVDIDKAVRVIKKSYAHQFMISGCAIDYASVKSMLEIASAEINITFKKYTHHIPCVLFTHPSPDSFSLGPVRFTRTSAFLSGAIPAGWAEEVEGASLKQRSLNYYKEYPWIASVEVESCDFDASFQVAVYACTTAINTIRVCFGSEVTKMIRLSTESSDELMYAKIWSSSDGDIECSHSSRLKSPNGPPNWYEYLNEQDGGRIKVFFGYIIDQSCALVEYSELSGRVVDAVNWFGDASREKSAAASIVKYVTAIERLYMASADFGVKERFVSRVSKILSDFGISTSDSARQDALRVYNLRSTVVHGGISPRSGENTLPLKEAEDLARGCILCAEQLYIVIFKVFAPRSAVELESAMATYEVEGLQWFIDKSMGDH